MSDPAAEPHADDTRASHGSGAAPDTDLLHLYLREARRIRRLTRDDEVALAARRDAGDADAVRQLVEANLRLVVSVARNYRGHGLAPLDLIQEGNLGLMEAARRFRPDEHPGVAFGTYAVYWIRQRITRAIGDKGRLIRVPVNLGQELPRVARTGQRLSGELGRAATDAEVAEAAGLSEARLRALRSATLAPVSLAAPPPSAFSDDGEDRGWDEILADDTAAPPDETSVRVHTAERLYRVLATMPEREAVLLRLRWGLDDGEPATLEVVARALGVTRERVRQMEVGALATLKKRLRRRDSTPPKLKGGATPALVGQRGR